MKNKRISEAVAQWRGPAILLLVMFSLILIHFAVTGIQEEKTKVQEQIVTLVQGYAAETERIVYGVQTSTDTVASLAAGNAETAEEAATLLKGLCAAKGVYEAVLCDINGRGYLSDGTAVDLSETAYMEQAFVGEKKVFYVSDDGIEGKKALLFVSPVIVHQSVVKYVVTCYDPSVLAETMKEKAHLNSNTFYLLIESDGEVLAAVRSDSRFYQGTGNYFVRLREDQEEGDIDRMYSRIQNNHTGITYVKADGDDRGLVYAPLGIGKLHLIVGIEHDYIENMVSRAWAGKNALIWQVVIGLLVFFGVVVAITIVSAIKNDEKSHQLENKADTDLLTELYNKIATERKIKAYMAEHPDHLALMFVLDIDNFKKINDTMGHAFGDEVLRSIGLRIRSEFRATDIIGRTGGDEFTIFLCNMKEEATIRSEASRVEQLFKDFRAGEYVKYSTTASIGAAVYPKDGKDFETLYKAADKALYVAKRRGKNQMAFYGEEA